MEFKGKQLRVCKQGNNIIHSGCGVKKKLKGTLANWLSPGQKSWYPERSGGSGAWRKMYGV